MDKHNSFSRDCTAYKKEFEIQKIKITQKIPISEARKQYAIQNPMPMSYARVTKSCTCVCKCKTTTKVIPEEPTASTSKTSSKSSPLKEPKKSLTQVIPKSRTFTKKDGTTVTLAPSSTTKRKLRNLTRDTKKVKNKNASLSEENSDDSMAYVLSDNEAYKLTDNDEQF